jgi:hypothetical protein
MAVYTTRPVFSGFHPYNPTCRFLLILSKMGLFLCFLISVLKRTFSFCFSENPKSWNGLLHYCFSKRNVKPPKSKCNTNPSLAHTCLIRNCVGSLGLWVNLLESCATDHKWRHDWKRPMCLFTFLTKGLVLCNTYKPTRIINTFFFF